MKRIVLPTKDLMIITGKSECYFMELIRKMKEHFLKEKHQYITLNEFANYLGLDADGVDKVLL
jgi:hypothetical protein